jgi:hypothetical protein
MEFLNKLYESNYFGIGLFAVISFLVVTFLIVLFFGKKDEKRRKLEATNELKNNTIGNTINSLENNTENAFKEVTPVTPLEMPVNSISTGQTLEPTPIAPVTPVAPIDYSVPVAPINMNNDVKPVVNTNHVNEIPVTPVMPINEPSTVTPIINEPVVPMPEPIAPIISNSTINTVPVTPTPVIEPINPIASEPIVTPIQSVINEPVTVEPVRFDIPPRTETPKVMEPIRITLPEEPTPLRQTPVIEPIIKENVTPIVTPIINEPKPIIEEPIINDTYYKPVEKTEPEGVSVPNIDFDAIAKSISKELDELERNTTRVAPIETPVTITPEERPTMNQFSSVYLTKPASEAPEDLELPKRIDLPNVKEDNNNGNYNI